MTSANNVRWRNGTNWRGKAGRRDPLDATSHRQRAATSSLRRSSEDLGRCLPSSREPFPQSRAHEHRRPCKNPMTDLLQVLPDFETRPFSHLLPSLDRALITTTDLLTLDAPDVAKRAQLPAGELRKLVDALVPALHQHLGFGAETTETNGFDAALRAPAESWRCISTLDDELDTALGGGIPPGYLTEVTGERHVSPSPTSPAKLTPLPAAQAKPNSSSPSSSPYNSPHPTASPNPPSTYQPKPSSPPPAWPNSSPRTQPSPRSTKRKNPL